MRDYMQETENRIKFIRKRLKNAGADGIVFGCSGGKDSALTGILCKKACENTVALIMPCSAQRNYNEDMNDALTLTDMYKIETRKVDLTKTAEAIKEAIGEETEITKAAQVNIAPRLRMTALYTVAGSENRLVAGTGNRSEEYVGYFTKWGDGACDFNPIADLTVTEIYEYLEFLDAPRRFITKPPSPGLYDGQTDEGELGITYKAIDSYLQGDDCSPEDTRTIERYHKISEHKRTPIPAFGVK